MTSGPDHYREAEQLLDEAIEGESDGFTRAERIAAAQVHAILALAAATASESSGSAYHVDPRWSEVLR
jgi:hypothetical protein